MRECPTCRAAILGRPEACRECGTPLTRARWSRSSTARVLTLICPGLGHLWLGYVYLGSFVLFVSFLVAGVFLMPVWLEALWRRLAAWVFAWIPWVSLWTFHLWERRRRPVSARRVTKLVFLLLVLANGAAFGVLLIGGMLGLWA